MLCNFAILRMQNYYVSNKVLRSRFLFRYKTKSCYFTLRSRLFSGHTQFYLKTAKAPIFRCFLRWCLQSLKACRTRPRPLSACCMNCATHSIYFVCDKIRYKSQCDFRYICFANSIYFRFAKT